MDENATSANQQTNSYVIDAENAAEMARLMLQDHMLTQAMGGLFPEQINLTETRRVLDIACGPGGWLLEVMKQYPHMQGVGIDISQLMMEYATGAAQREKLQNVYFRVMDASRTLDFPDNSFDLVNGRILAGFLSTQQWPPLLAECYRITKPGGILRLTEAEWGITNSTAYDRMTGLMIKAGLQSGHAFSPGGRTVGTTAMLRRLMLQAGYQVLGQKASALDYSAGTQAHKSNVHNFQVFYKLAQPFLAQMEVATQEELDHLYAQMEVEMLAEDFCAVDYYLTVWGHK
ncbi:class I SAM-dependent methyltransferase [Ktedonosporobacter rubrisoli]|uniref:Class I SAM-dependent methyltransferase n=1 Tax=Ktedonosporobacter rubrisoli TaxID=2509675 RepID=A0A4P6JVM0_KTERU|nr:class I SAM-dependent methyltransferase [Ktedonosporobacter rubrisoli]QBD79719.1 class I SAM-dependent methyltransferase [Ktedonosporobacter rubrisoli]